MGGVGFARAPLLRQYLSIRDTGIFGYPHNRNVAGDKRAMWCHAWAQQIAEALTRLSAQEDRETLPPFDPGREARIPSGAKEISPLG
jgi:hypothetical protein